MYYVASKNADGYSVIASDHLLKYLLFFLLYIKKTEAKNSEGVSLLKRSHDKLKFLNIRNSLIPFSSSGIAANANKFHQIQIVPTFTILTFLP